MKKCECKNGVCLGKGTFLRMWTDGWCADCSFDVTKCAEQRICEAYKIVEKAEEKNNEEFLTYV